MPNRGALSLDERTSSLFQADPLSSSEFFETKTTSYLEPERFLMLAVLQDAITCLEKHGAFGPKGNKRLFDEAMDWILSEDNHWLFSFNNVCEAVGLNAGYLRRRLIQMSERQPAPACAERLANVRGARQKTAPRLLPRRAERFLRRLPLARRGDFP